MKILDIVQGSPSWYAARKGIPTASEFGRIITPATGKYASAADTYAAELIAASLGWESSFKGTPDTERGVQLEKEALRWLNLRHGIKGRDVGFCLSDCGRFGASPDGLIDGCNDPIEIKNPDLHTFIKWRIDGELPRDHKAQCHGEMHVTGADRCIFLAYTDHPALDGMMIEVKRDSFTEQLGEHINTFCDRLDELRKEILGDEYEVIFPQPVAQPSL